MGTTSAIPRTEVASGVLGAPSVATAAPVRLSESLWGIDWSDAFPAELKPGIWAEVGSPEAVSSFATKHFGSIFGDIPGSGFWVETGVARQRYLEHVCDSFIVRDGDVDVGIVICNPLDWSSYYIRLAAFLPAYQSQDLVKHVLLRTWTVLARAGVARVEMETAPSNAQCMASALTLGFVVTGTVLSERWGALSRMARYLNAEAEESYLDRFCAAGRSHRESRVNRSRVIVAKQRM